MKIVEIKGGFKMIQPELPFIQGSDLSRAKEYLKRGNLIMPPDRVKEVLVLKISAATLGRKFRAASTGDNPELNREYFINERGIGIAYYSWNPNYKERHIGGL